MVLPEWAARRKDGVVEIDPDLAYPALLAEFFPDVEAPTQYHLEVAYQAAKMDVQLARRERPLRLKVLNRPRWKLSEYPEGQAMEPHNKARFAGRQYKGKRGVLAASVGKEARGHYERVRGFVVRG